MQINLQESFLGSDTKMLLQHPPRFLSVRRTRQTHLEASVHASGRISRGQYPQASKIRLEQMKSLTARHIPNAPWIAYSNLFSPRSRLQNFSISLSSLLCLHLFFCMQFIHMPRSNGRFSFRTCCFSYSRQMIVSG